MAHGSGHLHGKMCVQKKCCVSHRHTAAPIARVFFIFFFLFFFGGAVAKARDREISGFGVHDIKFTKSHKK